MSQPIQLDPDRQDELLHEAASRYLAVVVTCRAADGWTTLRSRFLGTDAKDQQLFIEYPSGSGTVTPEIVGGQNIGVSFRRSHKKCVFNTMVLGRCQFSLSATEGLPALKLRWPEQMCELQRRLYYRAPVPEGITVPVELWRGRAEDRRSQNDPIYRGTMLDLSAGGVSVALPSDDSPCWHEGDPASCEFQAGSGEPPTTVSGRLRHWEEIGGGCVRVGLHFVGLDSSPDQRDTLERVIHVTVRFQRAEMDRVAKRL